MNKDASHEIAFGCISCCRIRRYAGTYIVPDDETMDIQ